MSKNIHQLFQFSSPSSKKNTFHHHNQLITPHQYDYCLENTQNKYYHNDLFKQKHKFRLSNFKAKNNKNDIILLQQQGMEVKNVKKCCHSDIDEEILNVLKEENRNLKNQNIFLVKQIKINSKQSYKRQLKLQKQIQNYAKQVSQINIQKMQLENELLQLKQLLSNKIQSIELKLSQVYDDHQQPFNRYLLSDSSQLKTKRNNNKKSQTPSPNSSNFTSQIQSYNNKFNSLLYSCKGQKNYNNKVKIRKQLVNLTQRMRSLRSCQN